MKTITLKCEMFKPDAQRQAENEDEQTESHVTAVGQQETDS